MEPENTPTSDNDQKCLQCGDPLGHEPVSLLENHNPVRGGCHLRCVDAYHAQRREERPAVLASWKESLLRW